MDIAAKHFTLPVSVIRTLGSSLGNHGWAFSEGADLKSAFDLDTYTWTRFVCHWDNLALDKYMADNGTYRYRRYGAFELAHPNAVLGKLPHGSYVQPKYINQLNGGVDRLFLPLEDAFVGNPFFEGLLKGLARIFDHASGETGTWNIRLHPYRILTNRQELGQPTPEGLHRDGVDYIVTLLIRRFGITGGQTRITDNCGNTLHEVLLKHPLDLLLGDDNQSMHEVSPISCTDGIFQGYRDVLVIAFTRERSREND